VSAQASAVGIGGPQRLDRRRVYIFPSGTGFTLGVMLVIILLGAINYDNALGYLLTFLLGGLVIVAMLHTYRNLAGLRFIVARATPVFVGDTAHFEYMLENDSPAARLAMFLKYWPRRRSRLERRYLSRFETEFSMPAITSMRIAVAVQTQRRGWLALERVALHSHYPLGILRAWAYFESDAQCLVYPLPRGQLLVPHHDAGQTGNSSLQRSGADEFAGMRPYRAGDPVRAIAWKTLAKAQQLMVKRFDGQAANEVCLSWTAVASLSGVEERLSQLTQWVLDADRRGASYALDIPGTRIEHSHGAQHRERCLAALALYSAP
jgi:uncharacterized protein (DUF58 family)